MTDMLPEGAEIAAYRIESVIGRGGMAIVYRAEDLRLSRKVALKLLAPELARHEQFQARFIRESRLAASLDHPNIIPIYEAGEADGVLYIAMRYVVGSDLRQVLDRDGPLEPAQVLRLFSQIGNALDAAHDLGLVHRDVKPGNIMVFTGADSLDHVYLTDFGLTKRSTSLSTAHTRTGYFLGTIDYVAPEQIAGKPVDARTDIYAFGCMLYECLTGQLPFRRDDDAALLWAHLMEMPPPVSAIRPGLPIELDAVVARAMAKAPEERYGSCRALMDDLQDSMKLAEPVLRLRDGDARRPGLSIAVAEESHDVSTHAEQLLESPPRQEHPSFPPGSPDIRSQPPSELSQVSLADEDEEVWDEPDYPEESEEAEDEHPPARGHRSRWLLPAVMATVLALTVVAIGLFLYFRSPALSAHFSRNDRVPFSFDYPESWSPAGTGVNVVFAPETAAATDLFVTSDWTRMADALRSNPSSVTGLYAAQSFTQIDRSTAETLQDGVQQLLPATATFSSVPQRASVSGVPADELTGQLVDPGGSGATLRIWAYVVPGQQDGAGTAVLTFFAAPADFESQRSLFDRILKTVTFAH